MFACLFVGVGASWGVRNQERKSKRKEDEIVWKERREVSQVCNQVVSEKGSSSVVECVMYLSVDRSGYTQGTHSIYTQPPTPQSFTPIPTYTTNPQNTQSVKKTYIAPSDLQSHPPYAYVPIPAHYLAR